MTYTVFQIPGLLWSKTHFLYKLVSDAIKAGLSLKVLIYFG